MNYFVVAAGLIFVVIGIVVAVLVNRDVSRRRNTANRLGSDTSKIKTPKWPAVIILAGLIIALGGNCFTVVPTGYTGVRTTFGLIDQESCMPGFNAILPFAQKISLVNNKQQDIRFSDKIWSETKEQTVVYMEGVTVTYQIVPESSAWIYANVENWVEELVDFDIVSSALKAAARRQGADVVTDRAVIQPAAKAQLQNDLNDKYGENRVVVKTVVINNIDFDTSYNEAIAKKSEAIQKQQEQAITNQTNIDKAKAEAEAAREEARGEADAEIIRAKAKAEANQIINESVTAATQRQDALEKWDGELPTYIGGDGNTSFGILDATNIPVG